MVFSSVTFLFCFLPFTLFIYYFPSLFSKNKRNNNYRRYKNVILCFSSLLFYAWGEPINIILMLISILFNYAAALDMEQLTSYPKRRKRIFIFAVVFNLSLLGFFKYSGFLSDTLCSIIKINNHFTAPILPIGISFYTFQILSYIIDIYRKKVRVQGSLLNFALYISMFPQLIAGPIVQYSEISSQLENRNENINYFSEGIFLFIKGLSKKTILANTAGNIYDSLFAGGAEKLSAVGAWGAILFFAFQIYFDFSGYSDMAQGLGAMFGFRFPQNFKNPYIAISITDFWRRWHITLSSWFRDYVYIPMGGSRCSISHQIFNLFVVWTLTGLWHGAAWNFVLWGLYYFILLVFEKFIFKKVLEKIPSIIRRTLTFIFVLFGWVLFSCENIKDICIFFASMFGINGFSDSKSLYIIASNIVMLLILVICSGEVFNFRHTSTEKLSHIILRYTFTIVLFIGCIMCLIGDTYNPFLYFRF